MSVARPARDSADNPKNGARRDPPCQSESAGDSNNPGDDASGYWLRQPERDDVQDIVLWLADPAINQWFDFGLGRQTLTSLAVQLMLQSERHCIRMFGPRGHVRASGLAAVSELNHAFGTGSFWVLRDALRPACHDITFLAARATLEEAFHNAQLQSMTAWAVDTNARSHRLLARLGFQRLGIQRACHVIKGVHCARVLYDMLPEELCKHVTPTRSEE